MTQDEKDFNLIVQKYPGELKKLGHVEKRMLFEKLKRYREYYKGVLKDAGIKPGSWHYKLVSDQLEATERLGKKVYNLIKGGN